MAGSSSSLRVTGLPRRQQVLGVSVTAASVAVAALRVLVEGGCPPVAAVEARIVALDAAVMSQPAVAHLEPLDELLRVEVRSSSGALLVVHDLAIGPSCEDLAAAAAVVIATALGSSPSGGEQPAIGPVMIPLPVLPKPLVSKPPRRPPLSLELGLSVGMEVSWPRPGGGGFLWGSLSPMTKEGQPSRWGLMVLLGGTSLKQQQLRHGSVDWTRIEASLGPRLRLGFRSWLCDLFATVTPALVLLRGRDLPVTFDSQGFDLGLGGGVRFGARLGSLLPFAALTATGFVREQRLQVLGSEDSERLPPFAVHISLGLGGLTLP